MTILKLKNAGDAATFTVKSATVEEGQFGEQIKFVSAENGDILYIGKDSAERQLVRCGFGDGSGVHYDEIPGHALHFSRTPNAKKPGAAPFWNIELVTEGERKAAAVPSKRLIEAPNDATSPQVAAALSLPAAKGSWVDLVADLVNAYRETWTLVSEIQGEGATPDSIQAGVATILIAADKRGIAVPAGAAASPAPTKSAPMKSAPPRRDDPSDLPDANGDDLPF